MYSPEKNQIAICLLKSNLEEIENELVAHRSTWPELDAENEQKFRDSMNALRATRTLSVEIERLKQENVRLVAKRMCLKQQSEEITNNVERARATRCETEDLLKQEDEKMESYIREYEESLKEKAERFRKSRGYYCEDEMKAEIGKVTSVIDELEGELGKRNTVVNEKKKQLSDLKETIPANLLVIIGKNKLEEKLKSLSQKCEFLLKKRNDLLRDSNKTPFLPLRK